MIGWSLYHEHLSQRYLLEVIVNWSRARYSTPIPIFEEGDVIIIFRGTGGKTGVLVHDDDDAHQQKGRERVPKTMMEVKCVSHRGSTATP